MHSEMKLNNLIMRKNNANILEICHSIILSRTCAIVLSFVPLYIKYVDANNATFGIIMNIL